MPVLLQQGSVRSYSRRPRCVRSCGSRPANGDPEPPVNTSGGTAGGASTGSPSDARRVTHEFRVVTSLGGVSIPPRRLPSPRRVTLPGVSAAPAPPTDRSTQTFDSVSVGPATPTLREVAVVLRISHATYSSLNTVCASLVAALHQRFLAATSPDQVKVSEKGRSIIYYREMLPLKAVVGHRQLRRRASLAATEIGRILGIDPGLLAAAVANLCLRATQSDGVALVPSAAPRAVIPVREQTQFFSDKNISGALWQRVRLFLGGASSGLARCETRREDLRSAQALPQNQAKINGQGALVVSLQAAVQGLLNDLVGRGEFVERALRGADCQEIAAVSIFEGQGNPSAVHAPTLRDVRLWSGLDKVGALSSCKAVVSCVNQAHPCSRGNTILYGVFPCDKENHKTLSTMADAYVPDIDRLRSTGVLVRGERRAVLLILTSDYNFMST